MNILFDTNVVLDALFDRAPFGKHAAALFDAVEENALRGFLCATSVTTIFYLMEKGRGIRFAREKIGVLLALFDVAPVNGAILKTARDETFQDYEDAVIYYAAIEVKAQDIVTRDRKGFKPSKITIYSPAELSAAIGNR